MKLIILQLTDNQNDWIVKKKSLGEALRIN